MALLIASASACDDDSTATKGDVQDSGVQDSGTDAGETSEDPEACAAGTWDHDGDAATDCVAWSDCAAGTYVGADGTAKADRVCAPCRSGTWSTQINTALCVAWSDCAANTYVSAAPSATTDRSCAPCAPGTYSSLPNSAMCATIGTCAAGTHQVAQGSASAGADCAPCDPGTFCAGGSAAPVACASNMWDDDQSAASPCIDWTECALGQYVSVAGTATTDRECLACEVGEFSATRNAASCSPFTDCTAGQRQASAPSSQADRVCTDCESGKFSSETNALSCDAWTDCVPGQFISVAGTASADQSCASCPEGTTSLEENASSCLARRTCAEIKTAAPDASDGVYAIDVDGVGPLVQFEVYCDMSFDAGGWTLLLDSNQKGPDDLTQTDPGVDVVRFNTGTYLPTAYMQALAELSHQVHLRTVDDTESSFTTEPDAEPILRLRAGLTLTGDASEFGLGATFDASPYTGPFSDLNHLEWECSEATPWPNVYHACNNQSGLHLVGGESLWNYNAPPDALALFVR